MKSIITVLGGILGPAIVFPASLVAVITTSLASAFAQGEGAIKLKIYLGLSIITLIGSLSSISFTAINYLKPDNDLKKIPALVVLITGVISIIAMVYMIIDAFSIALLIVLLAAGAVLVSGLLQMGILKLNE